MKTYLVELKYEAFGVYEVEADDEKEAEAEAWRMLEDGRDNTGYGEWSVHLIQEK